MDQPISPDANQSFYEVIVRSMQQGEHLVLCTIAAATGSTPRRTGKMLVYPDARTIGTIGGGELEHRITSTALKTLEAMQTKSQAQVKPQLIEFAMSDPAQGDPGVCGGTVTILIEPLFPQPTVVVLGAGHVGKAVATLARWVGFRVVASDDREDVLAQVNDADLKIACKMSELPARLQAQHIPITASHYLVLTTRGVDVDVEGLPALLATPSRYIGVIGSRRRWLTTQKKLLELGVAEETLERVHSPVGLEIKAETPAEIAVSILGEIILVHHGGDVPPRKPGSAPRT